MSTQHQTHRPRRSHWLGVAAAAALLAAAAVGITALRLNAAHAVHPADAVDGVVAGRTQPMPAQVAGALPDAWQAPASDASVPSAREVFRGRLAPDSEGLVPTF